MGDFIDRLMGVPAVIALMTGLINSPPPPPVPIPTPAELQTLKHKVQQGDGPSIVPYIRSQLLASHPQLRTDTGQPTFAIGFLGAKDFSPLDTAKFLKSHAGEGNPLVTNRTATLDAYSLHSSAEQRMKKESNGQKILGNTFTFNNGSLSFVSLSPTLCLHCSPQATDQRNCEISAPAGIRQSHLFTVHTGEHEAGHILSFQLGLRQKRQNRMPGASPELLNIAEENFADTYAALRMIQIFGQEGVAYQEMQIRDRVMSARKESVSHWSVASLLKVMDYYKEHPELLRMPASRLPDLAEKLMAPPTQAQLDELKKVAGRPPTQSPSDLTPNFHKMAKAEQNTPLYRDVILYQRYNHNLENDTNYLAVDLSRINPTRPSSFTPAEALSTNPMLTPDKISALEALNQGKRHPSCPSVAETLRPK